MSDRPHKQRLSRLPDEYYHGLAWVHWTMTIESRRRGWLSAKLYYKFREIHAHVGMRYQVACPIFCMMPDHIHLLWCGLAATAAQLVAMQNLRKELNVILRVTGYSLERQPYDHVLKDDELERNAIEAIVEYIARNPESRGLVEVDQFARYAYTSCLLPGFPNIRLFQQDSWERIWRILAYLKRTECFRKLDQ